MTLRSRKTAFGLACLVLALVVGCAKDVTDYPTLRLVISSEPPLQPGATIAALQLALRSPDGKTLKLPLPGQEAALNFAVPAGRNIVTAPYAIDVAQPAGTAGVLQLRVLGVEKKQVLTAWTGVIDTRTTGELAITLRAPRPPCDADGDGVPDCTKAGCCSDANDPSDCNDDGATDATGVPKGFSSSPFNTEDPCLQCGDGIDQDCDGTDLACIDSDKDGAPDCKEVACLPGAATDAAINPSAKEICDHKDNDCDLVVDDKLPTADDPSHTHTAGDPCGQGVCAGGQWQCASDPKLPMVCSTIGNKTVENCANDLDDDCDGQINQNCALEDIDGDGVKNDVEKALCDYKFAMFHAEIFPSKHPEKCCPASVVDKTICDTNCDHTTVPCQVTDVDGDGYALSVDCNDQDPKIHPYAPEKCDSGTSESCGTLPDPACAGNDKDQDGWAVPADCDDTIAAIHPYADEICNGKDDNCDGITDDGDPEGKDAPCGNSKGECGHVGDKYDQLTGNLVCKHFTNGQTPGSAADCTGKFDSASGTCVGCTGDQTPTTEACNGKDDNCDGAIDEPFTYTQQSDKAQLPIHAPCDGIGACGIGVVQCANTAAAICSTDPGGSADGSAPETCNGIDDNCDGNTDEKLVAVAGTGCQPTGVCAAGSGAILKTCVSGVWACDFSQVPGMQTSTNPKDSCKAGELQCTCSGTPPVCQVMVELSCDGLDNDCDGATDEDFAYTDFDGISQRKLGDGCLTGACAGGKVICSADQSGLTCNSQNKAKPEQCNLLDDDCNGVTDEPSALPVANSTCKQVGVCAVTKPVATCPEGAWLCDYTAIANAEMPTETTCDGLDNDCNGITDDGCDDDGDGYCDATKGWAAGATVTCALSTSGALRDCNDGDAAIHPGASEVCDDIDNDCNAITDDGCNGDGDAYCAASKLTLGKPKTCPGGGGDCNDGDKAIYPGAQELCDGTDNNCDGVTDEPGAQGCVNYFTDGDGDMWGTGAATCRCAPLGMQTAVQGGDCDDGSASVHPGAIELCNGIDDNCDGVTDEVGAQGCIDYYVDLDGDGFGIATPTCLCAPDATRTALKAGDCDDSAAAVHPGATEACNGVDDNCDGFTDEMDATGCKLYYVDADKDTFGDPATGLCLCNATALSTVTVSGDCDDSAASVHPGATEACNGVDDNCDGKTDEPDATGCQVYFSDADGDGYGVTSDFTCLCKPAGTYTATKLGDCNDKEPAINPGAVEVCDGIDNNCTGTTDEVGAQGCVSYFYDADGDGHGLAGASECLCAVAGKYTAAVGDDCDDSAVSVHPGAAETCNGIDDNCNGQTDEGVKTTYYYDGDGDGFGKAGATLAACSQPTGYVSNALDCDDKVAAIHPGAAEVCNGFDDDCNGVTDGQDSVGCSAFFVDADHDGYGPVGGTSVCLCFATTATPAQIGGDCNDKDSSIHPGVTEVCDGVDNDCNGYTDGLDAGLNRPLCELQAGVCLAARKSAALCVAGAWTACGAVDYTANDAAYSAAELCDGLDNTCDGATDEGNPGAGLACNTGKFGVCAAGTTACSAGAVTCGQNVAASAETCDGKDNDCDGAADNGNPGAGLACNTGAAGVCSAGTTVCALGAIGCTANVAASADVCDGLDNDCNGVTDDGFGTGAPCGVGVCAGGIVLCTPDHLATVCSTANKTSAEICDGLDNDCDGYTDGLDADLICPLCELQAGVCLAARKSAALCVAGAWTACGAADYTANNAAYSAAELCDGLDNTCNGATDEGNPGSGAACNTGLHGVCAAGTTACTGGAITCSETVLPGAETCNGLDDNCNGVIDDAVVDVNLGCQTGLPGVCNTGVTVCTSGAVTCSETLFSTPELCNGLDDDCNGLTDDSCL